MDFCIPKITVKKINGYNYRSVKVEVLVYLKLYQ